MIECLFCHRPHNNQRNDDCPVHDDCLCMIALAIRDELWLRCNVSVSHDEALAAARAAARGIDDASRRDVRRRNDDTS